MPPGRRKATQPSTTQRTLAFGPHANKITKPNQAAPSSTLKKSSVVSLEPSPKVSLTPSPPPPPSHAAAAAVEETAKSLEAEPEPETNLAIREQVQPKVKAEEVVAKSEAEERAARVGEGDVRKYWRKQEAARKAPRVHQQDISMHEKILRHFDLSSQYGPCIGINRLARWNRASKLGLNPPIEVLAVLVRDVDVAETRKLERAYMDELLDLKGAVD